MSSTSTPTTWPATASATGTPPTPCCAQPPGTSDPHINAARVADRVIRGGHTVAIEKNVTRYERSSVNLPLAIDIPHRVFVFDSPVDGVEAQLCARTRDSHLRKVYAHLPARVSGAVEQLPRHPALVVRRRTG